MTMTKEKMDEIRALEQAATPGPWTADELGQYVFTGSRNSMSMIIAELRGWGHLTGRGDGALGLTDDEAIAVQNCNAKFIARARTAIPALLDALEAETKRADYNGRRINSLHEAAEAEGKRADKAEADRDHYKAKAEEWKAIANGKTQYCERCEGLARERNEWRARAETGERQCECGCRRETVSANDQYKCRMIYMRDDWYMESVNGRGDRQEMVIEAPCFCPWCGGALPSKEEIEQELDEFVQSIIDMPEGERRI